MRWLGRLLLRFPSARQAVREDASLERFRRPMDRKLRVGLVLLALGMITGWPAVALLGAIALTLKQPWILAIGGPGVYALSWMIYGAGLLVAGIGALAYLKDVNRWLLRRLAEGLLGGQEGARQLAGSRTSLTPPARPSPPRQSASEDLGQQEHHVQRKDPQDAAIEEHREAGRELLVTQPEHEGDQHTRKGLEP